MTTSTTAQKLTTLLLPLAAGFSAMAGDVAAQGAGAETSLIYAIAAFAGILAATLGLAWHDRMFCKANFLRPDLVRKRANVNIN